VVGTFTSNPSTGFFVIVHCLQFFTVDTVFLNLLQVFTIVEPTGRQIIAMTVTRHVTASGFGWSLGRLFSVSKNIFLKFLVTTEIVVNGWQIYE
jgi:hypothetical protein